jgi:hypothetical protein
MKTFSFLVAELLKLLALGKSSVMGVRANSSVRLIAAKDHFTVKVGLFRTNSLAFIT